MKTKVLTLCFTAVLAAALLAGCASQPTEARAAQSARQAAIEQSMPITGQKI